MDAFLVSLGVIFVAELGDKSQLMALAFATRYRTGPVLVGITVATALVHGVSVVVGAVVGAQLPTDAINVVAGLAFFGFAWWTWRGDELSEDEEARAARSGRSTVLAVGTAFFLAELGDKTMLATITLATRDGLVGVWVGLDGRHGGRRRPGHRRGPGPRRPVAGAGHPHRGHRGLRRLRPRAAGRGPDLRLAVIPPGGMLRVRPRRSP